MIKILISKLGAAEEYIFIFGCTVCIYVRPYLFACRGHSRRKTTLLMDNNNATMWVRYASNI